jgi:hypothetical protein
MKRFLTQLMATASVGSMLVIGLVGCGASNSNEQEFLRSAPAPSTVTPPEDYAARKERTHFVPKKNVKGGSSKTGQGK